jgi:hypothetical protein
MAWLHITPTRDQFDAHEINNGNGTMRVARTRTRYNTCTSMYYVPRTDGRVLQRVGFADLSARSRALTFYPPLGKMRQK